MSCVPFFMSSSLTKFILLLKLVGKSCHACSWVRLLLSFHQLNLFLISHLNKIVDNCPVKSLKVIFFSAITVDNFSNFIDVALCSKDFNTSTELIALPYRTLGKLATKSNKNQQNQQKRRLF